MYLALRRICICAQRHARRAAGGGGGIGGAPRLLPLACRKCVHARHACATCTRTRAERRRTSPGGFCQRPASASQSAAYAASASVGNCTHSTGAWTRVCMRVCMCVYVRVQTFTHTSSRNRPYASRAASTSRFLSCSASAAPVARRAARRGKRAHGTGRSARPPRAA